MRDGFKGFLEPRLHGTVFLHLDVDPTAVDVNVHPTKHEVRFRRDGEVFALVSKALQAVLTKNQGGFQLLTAADRALLPVSPIVSRTVVKPMVVVQERFVPREYAEQQPPMQSGSPEVRKSGSPVDQTRAASSTSAYASSLSTTSGLSSKGPPGAHDLPSTVRRFWQINDMFLLIETEQGIRVVDQHALHEKALWQALDSSVGDLAASGVQQLAVPIVVQLTAAEIGSIAPLLPELAKHGIEAERFGPSSVAVRAHPAALARCNWARFLGDLASSGVEAVELLSERIRHSAACHAAVKAGQRLDAVQQRELVRMLFALEGLEHCPHGRPTTLDLSWPELAKRFQR